MRRLNRGTCPEPLSRGTYSHLTHVWDKLSSGVKAPIRQALEEMQGGRCAYCESPTHGGGHIEHFCRRRDFPELTFEWSNLFLSCDSPDCCGHYKDRLRGAAYDPASIVKPDEEDPDVVLYFHSSGEARPRSLSTPEEQQRARTTIDTLNLNVGHLRHARERAVRSYQRRASDILGALLEFSENDRRTYIDSEIQATRDDP